MRFIQVEVCVARQVVTVRMSLFRAAHRVKFRQYAPPCTLSRGKTLQACNRRELSSKRLGLRPTSGTVVSAPGLGLPQWGVAQQPRLERQLLVEYAQLFQHQQRVQPQLQQRQPQHEQQQPLLRPPRPPRRSTHLSLGYGKH
jgi:hypothetical protein